MIGVTYMYSFGYSRHHAEVWWHVQANYGNDTMHCYEWTATFGLDGVE